MMTNATHKITRNLIRATEKNMWCNNQERLVIVLSRKKTKGRKSEAVPGQNRNHRT